MKILIFSEGRTGSHSLGRWLSRELYIPFFGDGEKVDTSLDDYIEKIYFFYDEPITDFSLYDKVIVLYRENILDQAVSSIYSTETRKYRHTPGTYDGYYQITKEFCDRNCHKIIELMGYLERNIEIMKKLTNCLVLSYEQIFYQTEGQKLIADYVGFTLKRNIIDPKLKLRKINPDIENYLRTIIDFHKKRII